VYLERWGASSRILEPSRKVLTQSLLDDPPHAHPKLGRDRPQALGKGSRDANGQGLPTLFGGQGRPSPSVLLPLCRHGLPSRSFTASSVVDRAWRPSWNLEELNSNVRDPTTLEEGRLTRLAPRVAALGATLAKCARLHVYELGLTVALRAEPVGKARHEHTHE
jgi:hypothetical protein